jgi:hypothetical protein
MRISGGRKVHEGVLQNILFGCMHFGTEQEPAIRRSGEFR